MFVMSSLFGERLALEVVGLVELPPRDGQHGKLDEHRWRVTLATRGTEHDDTGDLEVFVARSQFWTGEHDDVSSWIAWSLASTHPYDRWADGTWLEQLRAAQPIKLLRGLNRG
jgi:hypothetical protein